MRLFMVQFAYTADAWAALIAHPANRAEVVRGLVEQAGGRLVSLYYSFGDYDGIMLIEAPDEQAMAAIAGAAIAPGHVRAFKTTALFSPETMVDILRHARELSFSGPGVSSIQRGAVSG